MGWGMTSLSVRLRRRTYCSCFIMKLFAKVLAGLVLLTWVGYLVVSQPASTIETTVNPAGVHNLHLIDSDEATGFALYRLGQPDADDVRGCVSSVLPRWSCSQVQPLIMR